jgi:hypothetical protein
MRQRDDDGIERQQTDTAGQLLLGATHAASSSSSRCAEQSSHCHAGTLCQQHYAVLVAGTCWLILCCNALLLCHDVVCLL